MTKLKKVEYETQTVYDLEYGKKHWNTCKMRNTHCRTWNMARNSGIREILRNTDCSTWILARKEKNVENKTQILYDLEYGEKHWKTEKWKLHTEIPGIMRENWQMRKRRNSHSRTWNMARNTVKSIKWDTHTVGPEFPNIFIFPKARHWTWCLPSNQY